MKLYFSIYFFIFIVFLLVRNVWEVFFAPKKESKHFTNKGIFTLVVFLISYGVSSTAVWIGLVASNEVNSGLFVSGGVILVLAYIGRVICLRDLGVSYSQYTEPVPESILVTKGVYSLIRHPLYLFFTLEMIAFTLIKFNTFTLLSVLANVAAVVFRVHQEEQLLEVQFGEEFWEYQSKTKRFIPFLF